MSAITIGDEVIPITGRSLDVKLQLLMTHWLWSVSVICDEANDSELVVAPAARLEFCIIHAL